MSAVRGASSSNVFGPSPFSAQLDPRPQPATEYAVNFGQWGRWAEVRVGPNANTGGPGVPDLAEAGKPFVVSYGRSPADLGKPGELASVKLHYRIDGGKVKTKTIVDGSRDLQSGQLNRIPARIAVPAGARKEIEYWFELKTTSGETLWDSDFGKNYRANVVPAGGVVARFDDLWGEAISGPIKAGETLRIAYDADRLRQFMYGLWHHGVPTHSIFAYVSFDGGKPMELPLLVPNRGQQGQHLDLIPLEAAVEVPKGAKSVTLWFRGSSYGGSIHGGPAWDSDFGRNYRYPVVS
jgi:hypothetical protein